MTHRLSAPGIYPNHHSVPPPFPHQVWLRQVNLSDPTFNQDYAVTFIHSNVLSFFWVFFFFHLIEQVVFLYHFQLTLCFINVFEVPPLYIYVIWYINMPLLPLSYQISSAVGILKYLSCSSGLICTTVDNCFGKNYCMWLRLTRYKCV